MGPVVQRRSGMKQHFLRVIKHDLWIVILHMCLLLNNICISERFAGTRYYLWLTLITTP